MPKLQQAKNNQYRVTIPQDIIKLKGWIKGQRLALILQLNGDIAIKEI